MPKKLQEDSNLPFKHSLLEIAPENNKKKNVHGNIVYRQQTFVTRLVDCGEHGIVKVAKKDLEEAITEGCFNCDGEAIEINETIAYYCDNAEILYADKVLENIIFG